MQIQGSVENVTLDGDPLVTHLPQTGEEGETCREYRPCSFAMSQWQRLPQDSGSLMAAEGVEKPQEPLLDQELLGRSALPHPPRRTHFGSISLSDRGWGAITAVRQEQRLISSLGDQTFGFGLQEGFHHFAESLYF